MKKYAVIHEGTDEDTGEIREAHVWVGSYKCQSSQGGSAMGNQEYGICVYAVGEDHTHVAKEMVKATLEYDATARNHGGTLGAYRSVRPSDERVDAAISRMMQLLEAQTCLDCGAVVPDVQGYDERGYMTGRIADYSDETWEKLAEYHAADCEWIRTRARTRD